MSKETLSFVTPPPKNYKISSAFSYNFKLALTVFSTENVQLLQMGSVPIIRHTRVRANANPYLEPQYFAERRFNHGMKRLSGKFKQIWRNQHGRCYQCGLPMEISDEREIFYKIPKSVGGRDEVPRLKHCNLSTIPKKGIQNQAPKGGQN